MIMATAPWQNSMEESFSSYSLAIKQELLSRQNLSSLRKNYLSMPLHFLPVIFPPRSCHSGGYIEPKLAVNLTVPQSASIDILLG